MKPSTRPEVYLRWSRCLTLERGEFSYLISLWAEQTMFTQPSTTLWTDETQENGGKLSHGSYMWSLEIS